MRKLSLCALMLAATAILPSQAQTPKVGNHDITFAILSLNDFHGAFVQNKDQGIPGAPSVLTTVDSLKKVYPYHITVSAGDNFGGSYFYNATKGQLMPVFLNDMGIRISALGNHEFDDGQAELMRKWKGTPLRPNNWDITYICANVTKNGKLLPFEEPYAISEVKLSPTKTLKVALVGLLASSAKEQIRAKNIVGLEFSGKYKEILDSLKHTKTFEPVRNADIRALLLHIGTHMKNGQPEWNDKNAKNLASIDDDFYQAALTGHSHDPVCGFINKGKYPVVQGWWHGNYINVMKFTVDTVSMEVKKVEPEIVHVPLKDFDQLDKKSQRLQLQIDSLLKHTKTSAGIPIGTQLTVAKESLEHDRMDKYKESKMGELVCSSYSEAFRDLAQRKDKEIIVGVSHFGSIRGGFSKGKVSVLEVGEALPFSNALKVYKMSGKQLFELLQFGYNNKQYGWIQCSNLKVERNSANNVVKVTYVSPKGKKRIIKPKTKLFVVADEFITNGGDGYNPKYFPQSQLVDIELPATTTAFIKYLSQQPSI